MEGRIGITCYCIRLIGLLLRGCACNFLNGFRTHGFIGRFRQKSFFSSMFFFSTTVIIVHQQSVWKCMRTVDCSQSFLAISLIYNSIESKSIYNPVKTIYSSSSLSPMFNQFPLYKTHPLTKTMLAAAGEFVITLRRRRGVH